MKVAVFTTFYGIDPAYSLCNVAEDQIKMLKSGGYDVVLFAHEGIKLTGAFLDAEFRALPRVHGSNEGNLPDNYEEHIDKLFISLKEHLKDIDICITHDVIYQAAHIIHNIASRRVALEYPNLRWLHWIHSATSPNILCNKKELRPMMSKKFPNSFICYPNSYEIPRVAMNFGYDENEVKVVPHPIDICSYLGFHPLTREFVDQYNVLKSDIIMVYPLRLDRGKQAEVNIKVMSKVKELGKSVRLIFVDLHSTGGDKVTYRNELKELATKKGLSDLEVLFTSDFKQETKYACPREFVRDLFLISNVFILPSKSETYSLVAQEAAVCGNFIILNFDFPPMRSIYGDDPKYFKFSSNIDINTGTDGNTDTSYDDEDGYFEYIAQYIIAELANNRIVSLRDKLRKERNLHSVFKNHLEPLLYYGRDVKIKEKSVEKVFLIPAYDRFAYFKNCVESIQKYNTDYKILVVDHTKDGLVSQEKLGVDYVLKPTYNLGFANAMNALASVALKEYNPKYLIFCNEDVEFIGSEWWDGILKAFQDNPKLAAVNPSSPIDKNGSPPTHMGKEVTYTKYEDLLTQFTDLEGTCMWCTVIPKSKWLEIGTFDGRFYPAGGEDYDWHYRAYKRGYRVISTRRSWAIHYWSRYNLNISDERNDVLPVKEELRWNDFHAKWGEKANIYGEHGYDTPYNK